MAPARTQPRGLPQEVVQATVISTLLWFLAVHTQRLQRGPEAVALIALLSLLVWWGGLFYLVPRRPGVAARGRRTPRLAGQHPLADLGELVYPPETLRRVRLLVRLIRRAGEPGLPRGAVIYGPPGTGKTALVRSLARRMGVRFVMVSGGDLVSQWSGETPRKIRLLYQTAAQHAPAVVYIDEGDALFGKRLEGIGDSAGVEHNRIVGQLLTEIDGIRRAPVLTILSTNHLRNLDPALLSRLGLQIEIPPPGFAERIQHHRLVSGACSVLVPVIPRWDGTSSASWQTPACSPRTRADG